MFKNFKEFRDFSISIAKQLHTIVKFREYENFKYGIVSFMTDQFGGTYTCLKYNFGDYSKVIDTFTNEEFDNIPDLIIHITKKKEDMEAKRDLDEIYDEINSEY